MQQESIGFTAPVSRSFSGVNRILFQPFDAAKWFALGFSAWLAGLLANNGFSFPGGGGYSDTGSGDGFGDLDEFRETAGEWIRENLELLIGIGIGLLIVGSTLYLVLLWVSSRGKFMFLDNVVHNRSLVKVPWRQFRKQGNSLFLWQIGFGLISLLVILLIFASIAFFVFQAERGEWEATVFIGIGLMALLFLVVVIIVAYISTMLEDFVIPLMYRESTTTTAALSMFLDLHNKATGTFFLYFLWKILLGMGAGTIVFIIGMVTCCIGFVVLAIPYVGAVISLPISVFFRLLGLEFLRQFGSQYDLLLPTIPETTEI